MSKAKSFEISKKVVWEAYQRVKANQGAAGVDSESLEEFEGDLKNNLYKIWNRMSSGTYFPPPVRSVAIPKKDGGERRLGIPTVGDRIAQAVARMYLEPKVEPQFHPDSYGYRPGKSAHQALARARKRCWRYDWVIDLDIRGFFDNLDHELVLRAVRKYTDCRWILLYIERWLKAPVQVEEGTLVKRDQGTPQGGVISPLLANIFLHLAFDTWMAHEHPEVPFERYADDVVAHCQTEEQAKQVLSRIDERLRRCKLEVHPGKTKIVYCRDEDRAGRNPEEKFDFLGYTFRPRRSKNRWGKCFINFSPAVSNEAAKKMRQTMRSWRIHLRSDKAIDDLARMWNPVLRGWIQYYGRFYPSALYAVFRHFNGLLVRWAMRKYKRLRGHRRRAEYWLGGIARREPRLFAHWYLLGLRPSAG
ncbi:MAG: group II intron reverse transcriptase/maturase [Acidobacteriota bacterium]|nr:MAG: group II intron reverse transcriptase/maturase [Acidobacteriota bacterium]